LTGRAALRPLRPWLYAAYFIETPGRRLYGVLPIRAWPAARPRLYRAPWRRLLQQRNSAAAVSAWHGRAIACSRRPVPPDQVPRHLFSL